MSGRYQFIDNVTYYYGAHSIKSGFDFNFVHEDLVNLFQGAASMRIRTSTQSPRTARSSPAAVARQAARH
jgi:hypothetical protein